MVSKSLIVEIPDEIKCTFEDKVLTVEGPKGQSSRIFDFANIELKFEDGKINIISTKNRKTQKAIAGTYFSHINNMIMGVSQGFEYRLKVVYQHFPIRLTISGATLQIENFLGEKKPRVAKKFGEETKISIDGDIVIVTGINKEEVGQTAANIEQATKIKRFDPRVFQDGIYLIRKGLS